MKFVLHTGCASPHVLPLAKELVAKIGKDDFRYLCDSPLRQSRINVGWSACSEDWILEAWKDPYVARKLLLRAKTLYSGMREIDVFEARARSRLMTFYGAERWFKPISIGVGQRCRCSVPGWLRMLVPSYRKMAKRFVRWIQNDPNGRVLAIGPWAKKDMLRLGVPESKIIPWGYFVSPSTKPNVRTFERSDSLKVLWVGRMVALKRVDTIIRALREVKTISEGERWSVQLTLVGDGPEKPRLQRLVTQTFELPNPQTFKPSNSQTFKPSNSQTLKPSNSQTLKPLNFQTFKPSNSQTFKPSITFLPSQPIEKIRSIMREHDVLVFTSNGRDGWGAVVSEALEEGLKVLGTCETGASATMLPCADLFHAGDWKTLAGKLADCARQKASGRLRGQGIREWSAADAAKRLLALI